MSITGTVGMAIKTQKAPGPEEGQASLHGGGHIGNRTVDGSRDSTDCKALKLGFESSWPVRGRVDLADEVSVPYLVILWMHLPSTVSVSTLTSPCCLGLLEGRN